MSDVATVFLSGRMHSSPGDCSHRLIVMNESTDAAVQASKPRVAGVTLNRLPREELVLRWLAWWAGGATAARPTCDQEVAGSIPLQSERGA